MKNKAIIIMLIVGASFFLGCEEHDPNLVEAGRNNSFRKISWNGHVYIEYTFTQAISGITHDPDCPCFKEKSKYIENANPVKNGF